MSPRAARHRAIPPVPRDPFEHLPLTDDCDQLSRDKSQRRTEHHGDPEPDGERQLAERKRAPRFAEEGQYASVAPASSSEVDEAVLPELALARPKQLHRTWSSVPLGPQRNPREAEEESQCPAETAFARHLPPAAPRAIASVATTAAAIADAPGARARSLRPSHERAEAPSLRKRGHGEHDRYCEPQCERENEHTAPSLMLLCPSKGSQQRRQRSSTENQAGRIFADRGHDLSADSVGNRCRRAVIGFSTRSQGSSFDRVGQVVLAPACVPPPRGLHRRCGSACPALAAGSAYPLRFTPVQEYPLADTDTKAVAIGDVTGDHRKDVVVAQAPGRIAQNQWKVIVFRQRADGSLAEPKRSRRSGRSRCRGSRSAISTVTTGTTLRWRRLSA